MVKRIDAWEASMLTRKPVGEMAAGVADNLDSLLGAVASRRNLTWEEGGGLGQITGLEQVINDKVSAVLPKCVGETGCRMKVYLEGVGAGNAGAAVLALMCEPREFSARGDAVESESRCANHHDEVMRAFERWPATVLGEVSALEEEARTAQKTIDTANDRINDLL